MAWRCTGERRKKHESPVMLRGNKLKSLQRIYSMLLARHGILPSAIDKENLKSFFETIGIEDEATTTIDKVEGWA